MLVLAQQLDVLKKSSESGCDIVRRRPHDPLVHRKGGLRIMRPSVIGERRQLADF
jgi:hypothetical protein